MLTCWEWNQVMLSTGLKLLLCAIFCKMSTMFGQAQAELGSFKYIPKSNIISWYTFSAATTRSQVWENCNKTKTKTFFIYHFLLCWPINFIMQKFQWVSSWPNWRFRTFRNFSNFGSFRMIERSSPLACALACAHFARTDGTCNSFLLQGKTRDDLDAE